MTSRDTMDLLALDHAQLQEMAVADDVLIGRLYDTFPEIGAELGFDILNPKWAAKYAKPILRSVGRLGEASALDLTQTTLVAMVVDSIAQDLITKLSLSQTSSLAILCIAIILVRSVGKAASEAHERQL